VKTYILEGANEALLVPGFQLIIVRIVPPALHIVQKRAEPALGVERVDVGGVLEPEEEVLQPLLHLPGAVVQRPAHHHLHTNQAIILNNSCLAGQG